MHLKRLCAVQTMPMTMVQQLPVSSCLCPCVSSHKPYTTVAAAQAAAAQASRWSEDVEKQVEQVGEVRIAPFQCSAVHLTSIAPPIESRADREGLGSRDG